MPFVVGENIGVYRIVEQLGQGGMATVYKAYHPALDRYVAIKALHPAFMEDPNFLARFQREARLVAKLEHPNIVPVYDFAQHEGRPYLVMKFIEGETLKARLGRGSLSSAEIVRVVKAVGSALFFAHQQGILHRDIKPSNLLLAKDGQLYLADFGLARIAAAGESTLSSDMFIGTPQYISPEQAKGNKNLDEGTDIYSFGVMVYELLVGRVPFSSDTPYSIIHDHIFSPLPLPRIMNSKIGEDTERVLLKALAKERADRFEDVASFVEALTTSLGTVEEGEAVTKLPGQSTTLVETATEKKGEQEEKAAPMEAGETMAAPALITEAKPGLPSESPNVRTIQPKRRAMFHLLKAIEYKEKGQADQAMQEFRLAYNLADNNPDFLLAAGERLAEHKLWLSAAEVYLNFSRHQAPPYPEEIENRMHEAWYKAAANPEFGSLLIGNSFEQVDASMGGVVRARFTLLNGSKTRARELLDEILVGFPDSREARLLQAEMALKPQPEVAKEYINQLLGDPQFAPWIQEEAQRMLAEITP